MASLLPSSMSFLMCCIVLSVTASAFGLLLPVNAVQTIDCLRLCGLREKLLRLPCYKKECELGQLRGPVMWDRLAKRDGQDDRRSWHAVASPFDRVQKRVKEVWEGPAPADFNH